ncbi:MAG: hypothetical protein FWB84_07035 [Candidatus Bathyarchaeota archaeon]|uniref:hypothetical protein n=1 Tax=Candidatus Bathycorpusculum sp. TaxID=2994959 RepID=UPI002836E9A8|nr:hypothetical protein [Candidatus Termiticorpusculum sp.]MCL2256624.1 hypothetical protein [Candidatus Termiticorpusculum sp.]MCL2293198.1 hypothetical protein [Candidatus Termiticorpusculum sp.]
MFTKNKKIIGMLTIVIVGILFCSILAVSATNDINPIDKIEKKVAKWISRQETTKNAVTKDTENEKVIYESETSFYEWAYAKATDAQKKQIDKIIADDSIGLPGEWRRPILMVLEDLSKDTQRLNIEQATELFNTKEIRELEGEFNKIAGAPDFVGGSGIERSIYFLNDDRSEAIILMLDDAFYIVNNANGTQTRLPISTQQLSAVPEPSKKP